MKKEKTKNNKFYIDKDMLATAIMEISFVALMLLPIFIGIIFLK